MFATTKIEFESKYVNWDFKVNEDGYIETELDGLYSDTLYGLGVIDSPVKLKTTVNNLLKAWEVKHTTVVIITL